MALSAKVFALTVLVWLHGFFDCDSVVAQRTFQNIHRIFVVLLDGEDFFSGIIFICGGLKFDICADGYRERRIATDEVCPIFPVGVVVFAVFIVCRSSCATVSEISLSFTIYLFIAIEYSKPLAPFASPFLQ